MPKLDVSFIQQKGAGYCLPACVQMVLAFNGMQRSQEDIAMQLGIIEDAGIPASRVLRLTSRQLDVTRRKGEPEDLLRSLADSTPPIVEVQTNQMAYWNGEATAHVVLLAATQDDAGKQYAIVNDPAFDGPKTVLMGELILAWDDMQNLCATIRRK